MNPRLLTFHQATLLPHMGTETQESQRKMEVRALTNLHDYLTTGAGTDIVPELEGVIARKARLSVVVLDVLPECEPVRRGKCGSAVGYVLVRARSLSSGFGFGFAARCAHGRG